MGATEVEYAVICGPEDGSALWAAVELRRRGLGLRVVTTEELVYARGITHTVSRTGARTEVVLGDGIVLGPGLCGTLNRVVRIPSVHLDATPPAERAYVLQELQAVLLSLLHALQGVVVGRPHPRGLSGAWWRPAEWSVAAGRAGLTGLGYRSGGSDPLPPDAVRSVLVVGDEVIGPIGTHMPESVSDGCRRLAERHGSGLVGLTFAVVDDRWFFVGGDPWPDLRTGGPRTVDVLHELLVSRRALVPA